MQAADGAPPRWLGVRFDANGQALPCSGNTIVCHRRDRDGRAAIADLVARIGEGPAGGCFAFTAPESWHMTVFGGLLHDSDRRTGFWPSGLAADASDEQADRFMIERMAQVAPPDMPITMQARGFAGLQSHALGLALVPHTAGQETALRAYRDRLAEATGLTARPGHEGYAFHLTLGYLIGWPTEAEAAAFDTAIDGMAAGLGDRIPPFELGPPEICLFDHMNAFRVQGTVTSVQAATPAE